MKKTIILIVSLLLLFCTGCDKKITNDNNQNYNGTTYKLNDIISLTNSLGTMNIKFLAVTETDDRNEFEEKEYKKVIFVEYEYENVSLDDDFYINEDNFKIYDKNNNLLDLYPLDVTYAPSISKGRKATNKIAYGLNSDSNYIEIELRSQSDNKNLKKKVIVEW